MQTGANIPLDIGIVTDELTRDIAEAFALGEGWGINRFELREGKKKRFPGFTKEEILIVEEALQGQNQITAVSPGILKGPVDDEKRIQHELQEVLPRTFELAERLACERVIVFGFERYEGEPASNRSRVLEGFRRAAEQAEKANMQLLIENEPGFWVDRPEAEAQLLEDIGHPALGANWDPANAAWGGADLDAANLERLGPFIQNLHVKGYTPHDEDIPWRPLGQGVMPWPRLLRQIAEATALEHVVLETHCEPLKENSRHSLRVLRQLLERPEPEHPPAASPR